MVNIILMNIVVIGVGYVHRLIRIGKTKPQYQFLDIDIQKLIN